MTTPASDPFRSRLALALGDAYALERELTGGGMSRVFVATERALGRTVVVKVLPPELAAGVNTERFRREIQLAAQLQHPHIVPLLSAGEQGDLLWYTMPYIEGESLRVRVERGALPVRDVVRILHDVVDALAYAHARGVIHRDIKPGNILTLGAHALVTDFGVAKAISAALPHSGTTSAGMVVGSPAYMAPEQLAGDPSADHRVDLYAAGLLAYELLTGDSPFSGSTPQETMAAQLTRMPAPLHEVRPEIPPELSAVIMRCLEKAPERRYDSAQVLLEALDAVSTPQGAVIGAAQAGQPGGRSMWMALAVGAMAIVAVGGVVFATVRRAPVTAGSAVLPPASAPPLPPAVTVTPPAAASASSGGARDSSVVIGDTARGGPRSGARAPVVLSLADSMAIANAIRRRTGEQVPSADSIKLAFQRMMTDSLRIAAEALRSVGSAEAARALVRSLDPRVLVAPQLAPPANATPRIVVTELANETGDPAFDPLTGAVADSLRVRLAENTDFEIVPADKTREVLQAVPDRLAAGWTLRADYMLTGSIVRRGGQPMIVVHISDIRRGRMRTAAGAPVDPAAPGAAVATLADQAMRGVMGLVKDRGRRQ